MHEIPDSKRALIPFAFRRAKAQIRVYLNQVQVWTEDSKMEASIEELGQRP